MLHSVMNALFRCGHQRTTFPLTPRRSYGSSAVSDHVMALTWPAWIAARSSLTTGSQCASAIRWPKPPHRNKLRRACTKGYSRRAGDSGRNTAQNYSSFRARRRRQVRRPAAPGFVRQHGERDGFFRVGIDAVIGGRRNGDPGRKPARCAMICGIVYAAAGAISSAALCTTRMHGAGDGRGGQHGRGGDQIGQRQLRTSAAARRTPLRTARGPRSSAASGGSRDRAAAHRAAHG